MQNITLGFYDEKQLLNEFVYSNFRHVPWLKIYFKANNETDLCNHLSNSAPGILLITLFPKRNFSHTLLRKIKNDFPELKIAAFVYGIEMSQQEIFSIINAGASALFTDAHSSSDVLHGLSDMMEKGFHLNDVVNAAMFAYCKRNNTLRKSFGPEEKFCGREIKIIEAKRHGMTSREIADELFVSKKTVDGILHDLYHRFECKNFYELSGKFDSLISA